MKNANIVSYSEKETRTIGENLAMHLIGSGIKKGVLFLEGKLGAGKTVFAKGFAGGLGVEENIDSPTFVFIREYCSGKVPFYHFDLYRLKDLEEIDELGFFEYFDRDGFILIEWAEKMKNYIKPSIEIRIEKAGKNKRILSVEILEQGVNINEWTLY
ncbi:MAG: tRNA (adenosine(37)-N6)-threonylcarbamoyltransferase complex ATPase subunit type 1 TsaE [Caldisericota bacterium]|nr:tRNA (adenosine(37)-N6)-threonylcarbamoyltransferase complex ATPase subunit type 1 TsaE [Caldisericota bacterium]